MPLDTLLALVMLAALVAYALLGGADFGAGIWDLASRGPSAADDRRALAEAIGPVWEANHVWLIFLIVLLFTAFPSAYAAASVALFWPLHLVLAGIVLRGTSFVFRAYGSSTARARAAWGHVFGGASALTPLLLGACLGALSTGAITVRDGVVAADASWLGLVPAMTGLLALLLCAYLAAVYLAWESDGATRERFRRRALATWLVAGAVSIATLVAVAAGAPRLFEGLRSWPGVLFVACGTLLAPLSFAALWGRRVGWARLLAAGQVTALLLGWGAAQWPYLIYPDVTVAGAAAPASTLRLTAWTLPFGLAALAPSLWFLFAVFKGRNPAAAGASRPSGRFSS